MQRSAIARLANIRSVWLLALAAIFAAGAAWSQSPGDERSAARAGTADLWSRSDSRLQARLDTLLARLKLARPVAEGRLAIVVADVSDPAVPRVAGVNGDRMIYAASLPKIAILLGAMDKLQRDHVAPAPDLERDIQQMIRVSDNAAATRVLEWVGRERLLELLQSPRLRLYDPRRNGGLWVGKDYGPSAAYRRDPLHNLSHGATAMQVARLFQLLESGRLLDAEHTAMMKAALANPGLHHKFVKGLAARPDLEIYRKSGTWQQFHADCALVESGGRKVVMVGLADDERGDRWLTQLAAPLYDLVVRDGRSAAPQLARAGTGL